MSTTFKKVNAVVVDENFSQVHDGTLDAGLVVGGTYAANLAPVGTELSQVASTGSLCKGMPVALDNTLGTIVPIHQASGAGGARFFGVIQTDVTPARAAIGRKVAVARSGKVRSYAGATLTSGQAVKADVSVAFSGFVPWVSGTDDADSLAGHAYPLTDGAAIAQGDIIFVELR